MNHIGFFYGFMHSTSRTETAQEIATLRKEAQAFQAVRTALRSSTQNTDAAKVVFEKVHPLFSPEIPRPNLHLFYKQ